MAQEFYPYQETLSLIGSKTAANVITRSTLTATYLGNTQTISTGGMSIVGLNVDYLAAASETSNTLEVLVESSADRTTFYRFTNESVSAGTSTLTRREFTIAQATNYGLLLYDVQTGNFTVGLQATDGTATGYIVADTDDGTSGTLELTQVSGTWTDDVELTDGGAGTASVNGV